MRPLLASLALLLLGLCRPASAGAAAAWGDAIYTADSAFTLAVATRDTQLVKIIPDKTKYAALASIMGNTLHALMLKGAGKFDALPEYYKKALVNGARCELAEAEIEKKVAKAQYGTDALTAVQKGDEQTFAKTNHGIDCADTTKADPCLCTASAEKPLLVCLAKKIAGTDSPGTCRTAAIKAIKDAGKTGLAKRMEDGAVASADHSGPPTIDAVTKNESPDYAQLMCDLADPASEALVAAVYAADGLAWTLDIPLRKTSGGDVATVCAADKVASAIAVDKCVCDEKPGGDLCEPKLVGGAMKAKNYLDCSTKPPTYKADAKDGALAAVLAAMGLALPEPVPGPGAPTGAPGGNETTTAATGGAATSPLLLAPLAAAAAALLLL